MGDLKSYPAIRRALATKVWAVYEPKGIEMLAVLEMRLSGIAAAPETLKGIRATNRIAADRAQKNRGRGGAIGVIPVYGMLLHRPLADVSGGSIGTSCSAISSSLKQLVSDPGVGSIVIDFDTPGGDVDGIDELASEIYQARKQKPITAVSNCLCASAGYYLASQCSEIVVSPSSLTGSIGVYTMHEDASGMYEQMGVKLELVKYGEHKAEGNNLGPLTDSARDHLQQMVDTYGQAFDRAVARGRGITQGEVHKNFGQGRVFDARTAVRIGMADRVGTLDEVLSGPAPAVGSGRNQALLGAGRVAKTPAEKAALKRKFDLMRRKITILEHGGTVSDLTGSQKRADSENDCSCDCEPCNDDNCDGCNCQDCACDYCVCETAMKARERKFARMRHELAVAGA